MAEIIEFIGVLLNSRQKVLHIPIDKKIKTINLLNWAINKRKVTVKFIQQLTGMLNFLHRVIVLGRVFTRRMYHKIKSDKTSKLKSHHHVWLDREFIMDYHIWRVFMQEDERHGQLCCPFVDFDQDNSGIVTLNLASDASLNPELGMGAVFDNESLFAQWPKNFVKKYVPSIELLELYALVVAIYAWRDSYKLKNARVNVFCDNEAVVHMVNNTASTCGLCMKLLRFLVLDNLRCNRRVFALHIRTE